MSKLGHGGLLPRAAAAARGWLHPRLTAARRRRCVVVGHRGAARLEAENTLPSFQRSLDLGADAIETDLTVTADGRFALWHDADPDGKVALARQAGAERLAYRPEPPPPGSPWRAPVRRLTGEELREHYRYVPADAPEKREGARGRDPAGLIFLEDFLVWARGAARLSHAFLDIKFAEDQQAAAAALVELLRSAAGDLPRITFHLLSPVAEIVAALVSKTAPEKDPALRVSADFELPGAAEIGPRTGASEVSLGCGGRLWSGFRYDVARALRARDAGLTAWVTAWTISKPSQLEVLVRAGADAVLTDDPALLRSLVGASV